jgi:release factor glutamine methyltransferase
VRISALLLSVKQSLATCGIPSPEVDAEIIIGHILRLKRSELYLHPEMEVTPADRAAVVCLTRKRQQRIPLQYVIGQCEFMSLSFKLEEGVFIPRPETEVLVEALLERAGGRSRSGRILDLCTGCGAIAVSLARYLRPSFVLGTDVSAAAVEIARKNAILNGVAGITGFVVANGVDFMRFEGCPARDRFDVVACNPPYVEGGTIEGLEPEVRDHDPRLAIDGGFDGLDFIEGILPEIASILSKDGLVGLEIGSGQSDKVVALFKAAGLAEIEVLKDLNGLDRVVIGRYA